MAWADLREWLAAIESRGELLRISGASPELDGGRYIVVDDDVDPSNLEEVMWVVATRADPERSLEIMRYCKSNNADPAISIELKRKTEILFNSRAIIDACRPYEWKHEFYPIAQISPELRASLLKKWDKVLQEFL